MFHPPGWGSSSVLDPPFLLWSPRVALLCQLLSKSSAGEDLGMKRIRPSRIATDDHEQGDGALVTLGARDLQELLSILRAWSGVGTRVKVPFSKVVALSVSPQAIKPLVQAGDTADEPRSPATG